MDDLIRLHDGKLALHRRNGIWQARVHLGKGNYLHKSLKTANTEEAKRIGEELWHDTRYELAKGLPVQKRSFSSVLDEFVRFRQRDNEMGKTARSGSSIKYTSDEMLRQIERVTAPEELDVNVGKLNEAGLCLLKSPFDPYLEDWGARGTAGVSFSMYLRGNPLIAKEHARCET